MPSKEAVDLAGEILDQIRDLDSDDVDFVLTVLEASFPKGKSSSSGRKTQNSPKEDSRSSNSGVAQGRQGRGGRGRGALTAGRGGGRAQSAPDEPPEAEDLLPGVLQKLDPLTRNLPEVSRDPSADTPKLDRKSVQKRLNSKRAELQKMLQVFSEADDDYYGFEALNKIQAFLLVARDASKTDGVRLRTSPLPVDFEVRIDALNDIALERKEHNEVTDYGFFSNSDHKYTPPEGGVTDEAG